MNSPTHPPIPGDELARLKAEIERLRSALHDVAGGFVAGGSNMVLSGDWQAFTDALQGIAREALEDRSNG